MHCGPAALLARVNREVRCRVGLVPVCPSGLLSSRFRLCQQRFGTGWSRAGDPCVFGRCFFFSFSKEEDVTSMTAEAWQWGGRARAASLRVRAICQANTGLSLRYQPVSLVHIQHKYDAVSVKDLIRIFILDLTQGPSPTRVFCFCFCPFYSFCNF